MKKYEVYGTYYSGKNTWSERYISIKVNDKTAKLIGYALEQKVRELVGYDDADYEEIKQLIDAICELKNDLERYEADEKDELSEVSLEEDDN